MFRSATALDLTGSFPGRLPAQRRQIEGAGGGVSPLGWRLFILLNATLFLRPAEIIPSLEALHVYEVLIVLCLAASYRQVIRQFERDRLTSCPITLCVLGLLLAIVLSHLSHFHLYDARICAIQFVKVLAYHFLLISIVDTQERLRLFITWIGLFAIVLTVLSLLQYYNLINVPALATFYDFDWEDADPESGQVATFARLSGAGIFANPNDLARILVVGAAVCIYRMGEAPRHATGFDGIGCAARVTGSVDSLVMYASAMLSRATRWLWLPPFLMMSYALRLTGSRGGLLAYVGMIISLLMARFGWRRTLIGSTLVLPVLLAVFAGRQTELNTESGTGQQRIQLWSVGLQAWKHAPLFGIGANQYPEIADGYAAHNSFVHCYTELGLFGGSLFVGAFYLAVVGIQKGIARTKSLGDADLMRLGSCLCAIVVSSVIGMLSSSRSYEVATYMFLGAAATYMRLVGGAAVVPEWKCDRQTIRRLAMVGIAAFVLLNVYVRFAIHR